MVWQRIRIQQQAGWGGNNGRAKITNDDASSYPNLNQAITTVVGKVYKITATVEIGTATLTEVRAYSNSNIGSQQLTTDGTIEFYITADDTDFKLPSDKVTFEILKL